MVLLEAFFVNISLLTEHRIQDSQTNRLALLSARYKVTFAFVNNIHNITYIILQRFSQDYDLVFTPLMLCALLCIHEWRDLQFKIDAELQIFEKLLLANLFTLKVFTRNLLRGSCLKYFFFIPDLGFESSSSRLISQHSTY